MGSSVALVAHAIPVLFASGQVEISIPRLRVGTAGSAAICGAALSQLVSAPHPEARKLEGTELRAVGYGAADVDTQGFPAATEWLENPRKREFRPGSLETLCQPPESLR